MRPLAGAGAASDGLAGSGFFLRACVNKGIYDTMRYRKNAAACGNPRRYFLLSLCVLALILGRSSSFSVTHISQDAQQYSVQYYASMAYMSFCASDRFNPHTPTQFIVDDDLPFRVPCSVAAQVADAASEFPFMRQTWRGLPPLRSPPFRMV